MMDPSASGALLLLKPAGLTATCLFLCLFPTLPFLKRLTAFDPEERVFLAVSCNFVLMFLLQWGAYLLSWPQWVPAAILLILTMNGVRVAAAKIGTHRNNSQGIGWENSLIWAALAFWIIGLQSGIVVYGAVSWGGDWFEHYERSLFFLDRLPAQTRFLHGLWSLPARGPLYNASCALLMSLLGRDFSTYQLISTVLNTIPVLILPLLFRRMAGIPLRQARTLSLVFFALSPFAVQQETYPWTKFFTLAFILGAVYFCLPSADGSGPHRAAAGILLLAAGTLAHYMTIPFAVFVGAYLIYRAMNESWPPRILLYPVLLSSGLLLLWFGYCLFTFGLKGTMAANSTLGILAQPKAVSENTPYLRVLEGNLITSVVPYSWRHKYPGFLKASPILQFDPRFGENDKTSTRNLTRAKRWLSDLVNNQDSLLGNLGWTGMFCLLISFWIGRKKSHVFLLPAPSGQIGLKPISGRLWVIFFALGIPLNIALSTGYSVHGVAHINLQPFVILLLIFMVHSLKRLPPFVQRALLFSFSIESAVSTGALLALEQRVVPLIRSLDGKIWITGPNECNPVYVNNYLDKLNMKLVFLSDKLDILRFPFFLAAAVLSVGLCVAARSGRSFMSVKIRSRHA